MGQLVESRIAEVFAEQGLSHAAGNVLAVVEGAGRPMSAGDIATTVHVTSGSITSVLDTLERLGLVRRFGDPHDRRRVLVDITPEAETLLDEVLPRVHVRARDLTSILSAGEKQTLLDLIGRLEEHVRHLDAPPDAPGGRRTPSRLRPPRSPDGRRRPEGEPD